MILVSKYPGTCTACGKSYAVGDRVDWVKGVRGAKHAVCSAEGKEIAAKVAESRATDADISVPAPAGLAYLPYQRAAIAYAMARKNVLIADEMGLGKTVQAIGIMNAMSEAKTILVVCPASLKHNWRAEVRKWDIHSRSVGIFPRRETVTIVNYEQLKKISPQAWDLLVLDEAHYAKNPTAQRTQECIKHAKLAKRVVALTGTPLDKPREIYTLQTMLDTATWGPAGVERSKEQGRFYFRYCGPEKVWTGRKYVTTFDGATNLEELQERLRTSLMVRRLKSDVLTELPAKRRQIVVLGEQADEDGFPLDESGDYQEQVDNLRKSGKVAFEEISGLRHEQALRKLPKCIEYLTETLENNNEKVVVFAHHKDVIAELETALAPFGLVKIDGSTPVGERGGIVDAFQNGSARVFLGSIGAAGVGLTLTAASRVVFVELDWTPKAMNQAEDRCHRIGQKDTVLVQHLVIDGTLDAKIAKMLVRKQDVADSALDRTMAIEAPAPAPAPAILDDIAFTSCTCLAAPDGSNGHASWCDMFMQIPAMTLIDATPAAPIVSRETSSKSALTEAEITKIHAALRTLAEACDGANSKDGSGFNKMDAAFGHGLAMRETLTEKQALAARRMLRKYKRQIGEV